MAVISMQQSFSGREVSRTLTRGILDRKTVGDWQLDKEFNSDGSRRRLRAASRSNRAGAYHLLDILVLPSTTHKVHSAVINT